MTEKNEQTLEDVLRVDSEKRSPEQIQIDHDLRVLSRVIPLGQFVVLMLCYGLRDGQMRGPDELRKMLYYPPKKLNAYRQLGIARLIGLSIRNPEVHEAIQRLWKLHYPDLTYPFR
jgi:hypothetical protein